MNNGPPLPYGWVQKESLTDGRTYYVDTNARPSRTIWVHPYQDDLYLLEHPEVREMLGKPLTVKMLTLHRGVPDLTSYIHRYPPDSAEAAGVNVFRAIYRRMDPTTQRMEDIKVIIKYIRGTPEQYQYIEEQMNREIAVWRDLRHPNVAELLGIATLIPGRPPGLVSRWVHRHNFMEYIGRHPDAKRGKAIEISRGVQYLHEHDIAHGDLKVDNVIITDDGRAQINDFGLARILNVDGYDEDDVIRNVRYTAPELMPINLDELYALPTLESDIYSFGILLLQLFHGPDKNFQRGLPYNHVAYNERAADYPLLVLIHKGERPIRRSYRVMHDTHWNVMEWCWVSDPSQRPVIDDVLEAL